MPQPLSQNAGSQYVNTAESLQKGTNSLQKGNTIIERIQDIDKKEIQKEIDKEKEKESSEQPLSKEEIEARFRELSSRLEQHTQDPGGEKQKTRAAREEIKHADVANAPKGQPAVTGNAEADEMLHKAYRFGQRAALEMLTKEAALEKFARVSQFRQYDVELLRAQFLKGYCEL